MYGGHLLVLKPVGTLRRTERVKKKEQLFCAKLLAWLFFWVVSQTAPYYKSSALESVQASIKSH